MGCYTGYLIREADGRWRGRSEKRGAYMLRTRASRDACVRCTRDEGFSFDALREMGSAWLGPAICRGLMIDFVERRLRFYACACSFHRPAVGWLESREHSLRHAPIWAGWDVSYAWGGRDDFACVAPELREHLALERVRPTSLGELETQLQAWDADSLLSWERASMELHYNYEPWHGSGGLISVVHETLEVLDYCTLVGGGELEAMPWLVHGEALLDALAGVIPHGLPYEDAVDEGVIIDCPARVIRYWGARPVASRLLEQVREAWPGWQVERLRFGLWGHLAATGREGAEVAMAEADMRAGEFEAGWLEARRTLSIDPRPFRHIIERCALAR